MKKKILIVVIISMIAIGGGVAGVAGVFYYNMQQKNILIDEINKLSSSDITTDEIDMDIKSVGKYGIIERKIKEYLNEYASYVKGATNIMQDEQLTKVLTAQNYQDDGPEFTKTKEYLTSTKDTFNEKMQKLIDMSTEESIMKYIESENLTQEYIDLYKELMFDDEILKDLQETKTLLEKTSKMINEMIDIESNIIQLLIDNKDNWIVTGTQIQFTSRTVLEKYNEYIGNLSNIEM